MKLDTFTAAYIECALWTFEDNQFSLSDLAPKRLAKELKIKHADALEAQADKEGYIDYAEAVRVLHTKDSP